MTNSSFNAYVAENGPAWLKELMATLPSVERWGEVRMHARRQGTTDWEMIEVRSLWQKFWRLSPNNPKRKKR